MPVLWKAWVGGRLLSDAVPVSHGLSHSYQMPASAGVHMHRIVGLSVTSRI